MKENNNIDNLFKEGLGSFEVAPSGQVWDKVEEALFATPATIPFYRSKWMAAAILLLFLTIGGWFLFTNHNPDNSSRVVESVSKPVPVKEPSSVIAATEDDKTEESVVNNSSVVSNKPVTEASINEVFDNNNLDKKDDYKQPVVAVSEIVSEHQSDNYSLERTENLNALPSTSIYSLALLPYIENMQQPNEILTVEQYVKKRNNLHIYTGATADAGMIYYPSTEDQFTWAASAVVGLKAGKFYFESGVGYRFSQEQGSYRVDFKTKDSIGYYNQVTSFEINPQDPDNIVLNYKKTTVFDSIDHIAYTAPLFKYDYLTIPLRVGYRFLNKGNLFVAAEVGVEYNRLISSVIPEDGFYYDGANDISIINETPERASNNLKYMLSLRVGFKLNKNISIIAQPEFSRYLTSIYDTDRGFDNVKPYMMNLRAGIYFDF